MLSFHQPRAQATLKRQTKLKQKTVVKSVQNVYVTIALRPTTLAQVYTKVTKVF